MHLAAKMPETARFAEKHAHEKKTTPSASIARRPSHRKMTKETTENAPAPLTRHPSLPAGTTPHTQTDIGWQPCNRATGQPGNRATGQPDNRTTGQPDNRTTGQPDNRTTGQPGKRANRQTGKQANRQTGSRAVGQSGSRARYTHVRPSWWKKGKQKREEKGRGENVSHKRKRGSGEAAYGVFEWLFQLRGS